MEQQIFKVPNNRQMNYSMKIDKSHINQQIKKMSNFLTRWSQFGLTKKQESDSNQPTFFQDQMLNILITGFLEKGTLHYINIANDIKSVSQESKHFILQIKQIIVLLKKIFFESDQFLVISLDKLLSLVESMLETYFAVNFTFQQDEDQDFVIEDDISSAANQMIQIMTFLQNLRVIIGILANIMNNQIKILIRQRVVYSKELFNFESYLSLAMNDKKLVRETIFIKNGKTLMKEYFTFHLKQTNESLIAFDLMNPNQICLFINNLAQNFFKEFKMNYRNVASVYKIFNVIHKFFETTQNQTIRTFIEFNLVNLCDTLAQEQFKMALHIFNEKNFVSQTNVDKFTNELLKINDFIKFLFFLNTGAYQCIRTVREIQYKVKKFTDVAQRRIDKVIERQKLQGVIINIKYPIDRMNSKR
ncbi:UNKNOWN [Stylonychia lemnae]|uniref:Uncharacterized protein n=1 Tax=Stylonychia lemnae TaxID=5949 RepID=A0A078AAG9_STYLE|nr:UNKNOWN [Stylonychia lemnae]|eukprot:CDW79194.1 UNKNOWN [Stylonychia lemnae]